MSVPINLLYNYIQHIANNVFGDVVIYRFWPHGSKKLENLKLLDDVDWYSSLALPPIVCHDQEPLDYWYYYYYTLKDKLTLLKQRYQCDHPKSLKIWTIFDHMVLLHSEKNSKEVEAYAADRFIPVFYWSHAFIALDWFRYAQHIEQKKRPTKTFLIYNRAWSGTREYRIKVANHLVAQNLIEHCQTNFNCIEPDTGTYYKDHMFKNNAWRPDADLDPYFFPTTADSNSSADFQISDYESTDIEVVLETLFDDQRVHLTEKILRPIACAQPFILVAGADSLSYLKYYGFTTFDTVWDESYNIIADPVDRLKAIADLMKDIVSWEPEVKKQKIAQANSIAEKNKKHFFSKEFFNLIEHELSENLLQGLIKIERDNTSQKFLSTRKKLCQHLEIKNILTGRTPWPYDTPVDTPMSRTICKPKEIMKVLTKARTYPKFNYEK